MASYGYQTHVITSGDSLQKIAAMYGVEDWREIAYFNNLNYPFINDKITDVKEGNVANVGDTIFIPSYDYENAPSASGITEETMAEQAYGCDLDIYTALDDNGKAQNLELRGILSGDNGDLRLAKGINNLKQQITIRLSTVKGSNMLHPEFGSRLLNLAGKKGTEENLIDMMLEVKETILSDFRVVDVDNVNIKKTGTLVVINCDIQPISPYPMFHYNDSISTTA